jgi:hypothetical protein
LRLPAGLCADDGARRGGGDDRPVDVLDVAQDVLRALADVADDGVRERFDRALVRGLLERGLRGRGERVVGAQRGEDRLRRRGRARFECGGGGFDDRGVRLVGDGGLDGFGGGQERPDGRELLLGPLGAGQLGVEVVRGDPVREDRDERRFGFLVEVDDDRGDLVERLWCDWHRGAPAA